MVSAGDEGRVFVWSLREQQLLHAHAAASAGAATPVPMVTSLHVTYGGKAWVHWFLMIGFPPAELIELWSEWIRNKVRETESREPRTERHPEPKQSARSAAASRGELREALPEKTGVQHR